MAKTNTPAAVLTEADVRAKYPEGIAAWMLTRNLSWNEIDGLMAMRRAAFPATAK